MSDESKWNRLSRELNLPSAFLMLMDRRGLTTREDIIRFLYPKLTDLPSPFLMKGMEAAVELFLATLRHNHPVVIYGDYDVDGTSSTALLVTFLRHHLNIQPVYYLPNRLQEGYGLHAAALKKLATKVTMPALLVTVDCGIAATREIALAQEMGFKVIITDHHLPPPELPGAEVILNPKQTGCSFPFTELAGVGVTFFFIMALRSRLVREGFWNRKNAPNLKTFLDFVALGTIADVMPLTGTNRILVRAGLEVLSGRSRPGIWALCEQAGLPAGRISSEDISYRLAPRINAAGRLGNPDLAVRLLISDNSTSATELALSLEEINNNRKRVAADALEKALDLCREQLAMRTGALVLHDSWHNGIIGIIAARLVDLHHLPVIIFGDDIAGKSDRLKGSGRSIDGVDLYRTLTKCSEFIEEYGGHKMAAGLVIRKENLEKFTRAFYQSLPKTARKKNCKQGLTADYKSINGDIFRKDFLDCYLRLEPFGEGNPEPVFRLDNSSLQNITTVKNHLKFVVRQDNKLFPGIGFRMSHRQHEVRDSSTIFFKLKNTTFRGRERWEIHAIDIFQPSDLLG